MEDKMVTVQITKVTRDLLNDLRDQTGRPADAVIRKALLKLQGSLEERFVPNDDWARS